MKKRRCVHWNSHGYYGPKIGCMKGRRECDGCPRYIRRERGINRAYTLGTKKRKGYVRKTISPSVAARYVRCKYKELFLIDGSLHSACTNPAGIKNALGRCAKRCPFRPPPIGNR